MLTVHVANVHNGELIKEALDLSSSYCIYKEVQALHPTHNIKKGFNPFPYRGFIFKPERTKSSFSSSDFGDVISHFSEMNVEQVVLFNLPDDEVQKCLTSLQEYCSGAEVKEISD